MVDLSEIQAAYYMVAATGVLVAAIYYVMNLRITQRNQELSLKAQETSVKTQELALKSQQQNLETRQAQLFMGLYQSNYSKEMEEAEFLCNKLELKNMEDVRKLMQNREEYVAWSMWVTYLEGMGVLVRENLVDIRLVTRLISGNAISFWERYEAAIREARREWNWPRFLEEMEYLHDRIVEFGEQQPELKIVSPTYTQDIVGTRS